MGLPNQRYFPFTDTGKKQWRRDYGPLVAYEVRLNDKTVTVAAHDPNDAKVLALDGLRQALARNVTPAEKERIAQYLELRVTRRRDLDSECQSRGEIVI